MNENYAVDALLSAALFAADQHREQKRKDKAFTRSEGVGLTDEEIREAVRFGLGRSTTRDDVDYAVGPHRYGG